MTFESKERNSHENLAHIWSNQSRSLSGTLFDGVFGVLLSNFSAVIVDNFSFCQTLSWAHTTVDTPGPFWVALKPKKFKI